MFINNLANKNFFLDTFFTSPFVHQPIMLTFVHSYPPPQKAHSEPGQMLKLVLKVEKTYEVSFCYNLVVGADKKEIRKAVKNSILAIHKRKNSDVVEGSLK